MLSVSNAAGQVTNITKTAYIEVASDTVYVSPSGTHEAPFGSWDTAANNIQDAVDAALDTPDLKSTVLVGDGQYLLHETLIIEKNITVESLNGADVTILDGGGTANANRAVFIGAGGALFRGFTVSNAVTTDSGAGIYLQGGGIYQETGAITNTIIWANQAGSDTLIHRRATPASIGPGCLRKAPPTSKVLPVFSAAQAALSIWAPMKPRNHPAP